MTTMTASNVRQIKPPVPQSSIISLVKTSMSKGVSHNLLTWTILGGKLFMPDVPVSVLDYVTASAKGIPKHSVANIAEVINVPMRDMAALLNISYKTLGRKKHTDVLNSLSSSLSIEIAGTVSKGLGVFEDIEKLSRWLQKGNRALQGKKPFDLLNTPTGIKMVYRLLDRIEEGVYT